MVRAEHEQLRSASTPIQPPSTIWQPVGPPQVSTSQWNLVTGPVISLAVDPSDSSGNTLYAGTGGGGVWKSTNAAGNAANISFVPLTDTLSAWSSATLTSLSIGSVSVQPGGTGVILAGTGDPNSGTSSWYGAGILRSADGGSTWTLMPATGLDEYGLSYSFLGNAVAGFAWSGSRPNLVVAAVSDSGNETTAAGILTESNVLGMYYSLDAGGTWELATLEDGTQVFQGPQYQTYQVNAATSVVWNPIRQRFYAAIRFHGYYESADGVTWTRLINQPGANLTLNMCPTILAASGSHACPIARGALAVQPVTGDMFALTVDSNNLDQGLWQDACQATSGGCAFSTVKFATRISDGPLQSPSGSGTVAQADSSLWLTAVSSQQDTLLFVGAQDIWRCSLANSCTWRNTTNTQTCAAAMVAPAQYAVESTFGSTGLLYFGNEAGMWRSTDAVNQQKTPCSSDDAGHYQNLNGGLGSLAEVEGFSEDPSTPTTWLAALGDLGTAAPSAASGATAWNQVLDGEGDVVAIDPANPQNWYATSESGVGINRCTEGASCTTAGFGNVVIGEAQVQDDFESYGSAPWILDPQNTANLILGTCRVWRGPATGAGWSQSSLLSTMLDQDQGQFCDGNAQINFLAAARITTGTSSGNGAEQIYAGMAGVFDGGGLVPGHIFTATVNSASQVSNTKWVDLYSSPVTNKGSGVPQFDPDEYAISSIYPDPHDPTGQTVYVTVQGVSGIGAFEPIVYSSTDGGAHWTNITSNLPLVPANSIFVDPNNANIVYVALDSGVYVTQNLSNCALVGQACWNVYGSGLPNSPVVSLMAYNEGATQTLRAATYGRGIWQVDLVTAEIAPTAATILPSPLAFPSQQVQTTSAAQSVTITDTGTLDLNITSLTVTGDFAETDNCTGQSITLNGTCQISVTFAPTQSGARIGLLTVFGNVPGGQLTVSLAGTGLAPASIVLTPSSLSFGPTTVGSPSAPQYVTIANTGDIASTLTSETATGDFSLSANTCTGSLAGNYSCTVGIVFTPGASGTRNGVLTVTDSVGTQSALLSGTGQTKATDALAPVLIAFAAQQVGTVSASQLVTLTNIGDQPLTSIAVATTGDFTAVNNCGALLQGDATCTISIAYVPTVAGAESGTLTVTDEIRSQKVALSGTGVAPPGASALPVSINFGGYAFGTTSSAQTVTVTNSGGYDLSALTATTTSGFTLASDDCPATLSVGASCHLGVTYSAATAGPVTGTLTIAATNLAKALTVTLSGQGDDFLLAISGTSSAIITSGQSATFPIQLQGLGGTSGTVALACTGAPQYSTCSLNPTSIALNSSNTSGATATITTGVSTTSAALDHSGWKSIVPVLSLALPLWFGGFRRRKQTRMLIIAVFVGALMGCGVAASSGGGGGGGGGSGGGGGGTGTQNQTPSGTYTITVTGTMSNITHSATITLTVQ
jgi:hypothetical protein